MVSNLIYTNSRTRDTAKLQQLFGAGLSEEIKKISITKVAKTRLIKCELEIKHEN